MAATGKTPILLYGSTTATNAPVAGNLTNSSDGCEIAINVADKNLFFKDSTNTVNTVPIRQSSASSNGWLSSTDWSTFNGKAPAFTYTTGYIPYGQGTTTPTQSANLFFDSTNKRLGVGTVSPVNTIQAAGALASIAASGTNAVNIGDYGSDAGTFRIAAISGRNLTFNNDYAGVEDARFDANGNYRLTRGNLVIGTSGKGIDFSATAGTGTSELLADYEEGTWTPTLASGGCSGTCVYTKVGRLVTVSGTIEHTSNGSGTAAVQITNLPFQASSAVYTAVFWYGIALDSGDTIAYGYVANGSNIIAFISGPTSGGSGIDASRWLAGASFAFNITYIA